MRRRCYWLLVACSSCSFGAAVGFLAGTVVRDRASFATLTAPVRPVEARNAGRGTSGRADEGPALCGDVDLWDGRTCTHPAGHHGDHGAPNAAWWTSTPDQPRRKDA